MIWDSLFQSHSEGGFVTPDQKRVENVLHVSKGRLSQGGFAF